MTTKLPSICCGLASRGNVSSIIATANGSKAPITTIYAFRQLRHNSSSPPKSTDDQSFEKAALRAIQNPLLLHPVNPPRSTLAPDLIFPERKDFSNAAAYWYKIGRTYGGFYFKGIKAVWWNWSAAKLLKQQKGTEWEGLKRSEFQLLARNGYDIGKLPFFGVLVLVFGEWLPLLVPFIPSAVPGTCRIPKQVQGMRMKAEERRRAVFRRGISEPGQEIGKDGERWALTDRARAREALGKLRDDQLFHLSCTLNNHNRLWDRVQLPPPAALLRSGISKKLSYIGKDDKLLLRDGGAKALSEEELLIACEERGLDVLGKEPETLRKCLEWWLRRQKEDEGKVRALFTMLFRRPNAWDTKVNRR